MDGREFNFDGLIGPTHNYAGLSYGNVASAAHQNQASQPRAAALQGLQKMRLLAGKGIGQCLLPPLRRPRIELLRQLGFGGKQDSDVVESAYRVAPQLVATCYSAASMWTANAATVSPAADCGDRRMHLTPANLSATLHRSIEATSTRKILQAIFHAEDSFVIHDPLPGAVALSDEGAANQTRLCADHGGPGIEVFVYGSIPHSPNSPAPRRFPARQTLHASQAVARKHELDPDQVLFWQQNPEAIDAGVFHNDVISVGNQNMLLCHEMAFVNQVQCLRQAREVFQDRFGAPLQVLEFSDQELPLADAVRSYLFNSQLVTRPDGKMSLICPVECDEIKTARHCTQRILEEDNPVAEISFMNLRQSMNNGGGPACLRLRVVLSAAEQAKIHQGIVLTSDLADRLEAWVSTHYREELRPDDLRDPNLIDESYAAIEALAGILNLPVNLLLDR